jgi:hypothetical protein
VYVLHPYVVYILKHILFIAELVGDWTDNVSVLVSVLSGHLLQATLSVVAGC